MKILCVIDSLGSGGAQRQLVELARGFKERGNEVSFLTYHSQNFYTAELLNMNIKVSCIEEPNYLKRIWKMRIFIRRGGYDTVLSFLEGSNFICELAGLPSRKWKLIVGERSANPTILQSFKSRLLRWFHVFSDYIVANSHENIRLIKEVNFLNPADKYKVIYNMVDFENWKSDEEYIPFKNNKFNFLVAASHQYLKNAKGLLEAINQLSVQEQQKLKIDWYGDESPDHSFKEAKQLIKKYNLQSIITFHRATKDICDKIWCSDFIALFSFYEGLPNIICEAMVMGKPVISSSISDVPRLINKNNKLIFNPDCIQDIAKTISHALSLSLEDMRILGEQNKKKGYELFEKNKIVSQYLALFN